VSLKDWEAVEPVVIPFKVTVGSCMPTAEFFKPEKLISNEKWVINRGSSTSRPGKEGPSKDKGESEKGDKPKPRPTEDGRPSRDKKDREEPKQRPDKERGSSRSNGRNLQKEKVPKKVSPSKGKGGGGAVATTKDLVIQIPKFRQVMEVSKDATLKDYERFIKCGYPVTYKVKGVNAWITFDEKKGTLTFKAKEAVEGVYEFAVKASINYQSKAD